MIDSSNKKCTACGACVQKCPKGCIELKSDFNGFLYPTINATRCVECGLCGKVCPIEDTYNGEKEPLAYACASLSDTRLLQSTSGGVFGELATYILDRGGVVYGCAYTGHLKATHIRVDCIDSLSVLFGSKYVQSNTCDTFKECELDLKNGREVLYSGTPCQIAGLKKFLQKEYSNLITIDLVCHGVASQDYFDKFISYLESAEEAKCTSYNFRSKKNAGWSVAGVANFIKADGTAYEKKQYYFTNYYYFYYLSGSIYRESCYSCKYSNLSREGDFTLGDFWGAEGLSIPFDVSNGCSLVLVNTKAAAEIFDKIELNKFEVSLDIATKYNKQLTVPSCARHDRTELLREYREEGADIIQKNFVNQNRKAIFLGKLKYLMPDGIKQSLLKLRYRK